ncbi:unnamed protein product [Rotaria sordida]|uniref:Inositol polyphosphate-related phosphatase domain-containing protein n=1 Tax=Rotaria sordida TaxID=392033 RepID=A0A814K2P3_9BILA|nr:unnamed protein product [Rotaria sordida]CAF0981097.1 unnamed protein product [Rotaria sordida]CAF1045756.1 unnamed protein product [Rotaria sordida]CAF1161933.1 unnamed protein product [Rotaria sordida]CAF3647066.1 unnamed protein product [Rotaria sordida]
MTDDTEKPKTRDSKPSFSLASVPEESEANGTISELIKSTPLADPNAAAVEPTNISQHRSRRRSSLSILQAIAPFHLLSTKDARKRNFLVGSSRQLPQNPMHDISSCFPNGRSLTIMMVTWNTGEAPKLYEQNYTPTARETAQPKERMLDDMCDILLPTFIDYVSDVIIVCTQEMSAVKNRMDWEILLQEVIGQAHVLFHSVHFGTLSLCIFLRRDLIWYCTEPEEDIIKFRAMNAIRTKGSLVVTFNLFGTSFMIINSHFEAGEGSEGRSNRRLNFQNTLAKLTIPNEYVQRTIAPSRSLASLGDAEGLKRSESTVSLDDVPNTDVDITKACDCILWAGDMNFRIEMKYQEALDHCNGKNYTEILLNDEFRMLQQKTGDRYCDFKEANIDFPPTYKFDLRCNDDTYVKNRTPSYTDRILYRDKPELQIQCTQYKSIESVKHSDHKPVVAHFRLKVKPGVHQGSPSYGKFNYEVYKRGCIQRERHHSLGVGVENKLKPRAPLSKSSVCVLQ